MSTINETLAIPHAEWAAIEIKRRQAGDYGDFSAHDSAREAFKLARAQAVKNITVTTAAGNVFDGDETSQGRMARAILGLQSASPGATVGWVLAGNTEIEATAAELSEALALAGAEQARLWLQG